MRPVVYDAGVLIAADHNDRRAWVEHRVRLENGILPLVPSTVVAQVSRSRTQVQLRRFLAGCDVASFDEAAAYRAGTLLAKAATQDVVDASVVALAVTHGADIATGDRADIRRLVDATGAAIAILPVTRTAR